MKATRTNTATAGQQAAAPRSQRNARQQSGISIHDVIFVLFKHKWKILLFSLLGIGSGAAVYYKASLTPHFESTAKLLVRYVQERSAVDAFESREDASGRSGAAVMGTELEILHSVDVMMATAEKVGPELIIPNAEEPPTAASAAQAISKGLDVSAMRGSNVINMVYNHTEPETATKVLDVLIKEYFAKHLEVHRSTQSFDAVARQTDQARTRLRATEEEIKKLQTEAGIVSVADSMSALEARRRMISENLISTEAELVHQQAKVSNLDGNAGTELEKTDEESEKVVDLSGEDTRKLSEATVEYRDALDRLEIFKSRRNQLLLTRPPNDRQVVELKRNIDREQERLLAIVEQYPALGSVARTGSANGTSVSPVMDLNAEKALLAALTAKKEELIQQAKKLDEEFNRLSDAGLQISSLERRRKMEAEKYQYLETSLEKARVDETLNPQNMPNINVVQQPSAPVKTVNDVAKKLAFGLGAAGVMLGLVLAFLIEFVIDRRLSRPLEIHTRLQIPLVMSIPYLKSKDNIGMLLGDQEPLRLTNQDESPASNAANSGSAIAKSMGEHFIMPYAEAIRDRIVFNFEVNNITHKPKLVALTGLSSSAGTSTISAGVARAFADGGNRKVLLVSLNTPEQRNGHVEDSKSTLRKALEVSRSEQFRKCEKNLYVINAPATRNRNGNNSLTAMDLHQLMPSLDASDFDYIIFDLPPVSPTSPTVAMAGFMDKVLLVLDSEKTTREGLQWGYSELEKTRADVSCIYNKARSHAPKWVEGGV
jgi:uncharacterized protein involved in exopolysaccharide biosynthesis/Mrp family chromosome partitioning ATPase